MILKNPHLNPNRTSFTKSGWLVGGLLVILLAGMGINFVQWGGQQEMESPIIRCSAESVKLIDGKTQLTADGQVFSGIETQSREAARTGNYSSKIDSANKYGIGYTLTNAQIGERYRATIWRRGHKLALTYLAVNIPSEPRFYKQEATAIEVDDQEWEKLELIFEVPESFRGEAITVYSYGLGGRPVYVDDFTLERIPISEARKQAAAIDTIFHQLGIRISPSGLQKLKEKRKEALYRGILFSSDDDWVSGNLMTGKTLPAKFRFKGDWMDHLSGDKWSFRIKLKAPNSWNRLVTFSVQNPGSRHYLSEWVYHQLLDREDVLTTRYDFLHLDLNGQPKGIYAYEEHFEKQLVEYRGRREGPIVKFSEQGVWKARKRRLDMEREGLEMEQLLNSMEAARTEPFKESSTLKNPLLAEQFEVAQSLMHQYQWGLKSASEVFDVEKLAKFYALTDLTRAYHSLVWHNQRFYFNPVTNKLEPIGYDGFTGEGEYPLTTQPFVGAGITERSGELSSDLLVFPFLDSAFMRHYIHYLDIFSQKNLVENFLLDIKSSRGIRENLIKQEYPNYKDVPTLVKNASRIRSVLYPLKEGAVKAFTQQQTTTEKTIQIANFHLLPLEIIGWGTNEKSMKQKLNTPLWMGAYNKKDLPNYHTLTVPKSATYIFFKMPGAAKIYVSLINSWQVPGTETPYQKLFSQLSLSDEEIYSIDGQSISFHSGEHTIKTPLLIPKGYEVNIPSGTSLDFINKAYFISQSPVLLGGTEESPIRIHSSDQSAQGFSIIEAKSQSSLKWVSFEHFNTLQINGWKLTGAVTFYDSPVKIEHCSFLNNHCEDALNIIRSDFEINRSNISFAYADGLDVDFSKGKIDHLKVYKAGNDGLDFSGSKITLSNCQIEDVGDKGISVGEEATVTILSATVNQAISGVVAKDLSNLHIRQVSLQNCETGFAAYQKKPEYGGARIRVDKYQADQVKHLHLIEQGSELILRGKVVEGI